MALLRACAAPCLWVAHAGTLEEFDGVCGTPTEYRLSLSHGFETGKTGDLIFPGFLQLCSEAWTDPQLIHMCKQVGVELRWVG